MTLTTPHNEISSKLNAYMADTRLHSATTGPVAPRRCDALRHPRLALLRELPEEIPAYILQSIYSPPMGSRRIRKRSP